MGAASARADTISRLFKNTDIDIVSIWAETIVKKY